MQYTGLSEVFGNEPPTYNCVGTSDGIANYRTMQRRIERIKANVLEVEPSAEVWLYGSRSRGTAREDSDWDILVLSPHDTLSVKEEGVFIDHMTDLMIETGQVVHLFAYGKNDWHSRHRITPFYQNITHEAIKL